MTCGIYAIRNKVNGKLYIGSSNDIERRWRYEHLLELRRDRYRRGDGERTYFQKSWWKYGEENFELLALEECPEDRLIEIEQWWLDYYRPLDKERRGYNSTLTAGRPPSWVEKSSEVQESVRQRARDRRRGTRSPVEWGRSISRGKKGKTTIAQSTREAVSRSNKTRINSEESNQQRSKSVRAAWAAKSVEEKQDISRRRWETRRANRLAEGG